MKRSYYLFSNGELKRRDNSLIIKNDKTSKYIPVEDVNQIYVFGEISFNSKLTNFLFQNNITVHFFNYYGYYSGSFYPRESLLSGDVHLKQAVSHLNFQKRLLIAKEFIDSASFNISRNLKYYNRKEVNLETQIKDIELLRNKLNKVNSIEELMGIEGNIRKIYYSTWNFFINQNINFHKREKHPPKNWINSLISFINSLIYTTTLTEIYHTHLDPTISFLHSPSERRFSLSLDISEIFKPIIGDRLIFSLLNKNMITHESFIEEFNHIILKDSSKKIILKEFDERLKKTIKHKKLNRKVSYRKLIRLECYKLEKHIIEEKKYEGFKIWW
ncbi:type I-B CRISPR-associated endonuclease Cas1b [Oceanotoga teriensis]|jgi:CRISPR-associated protein Cas1|uniref:type I-B CRISPR-associated endonuclease Cas1b n=1 Tax=Oceanotoga teriensis TaxID=515440 RepID=UPI0027134A1D|nr:type I-B CRISPR-associated endonuclease Cas1b [Oceanotoga teriensis]MDO7976434.1 type I-B CRISPR-associated endonuclease Cas1b [Oceanotoga teriensis]